MRILSPFFSLKELISYLQLFLLDHGEPEVELDEVREEGVEVCVQLEEDDLLEVGVVDVGHHVEEQPVDLLHVALERRRELHAFEPKMRN